MNVSCPRCGGATRDITSVSDAGERFICIEQGCNHEFIVPHGTPVEGTMLVGGTELKVKFAKFSLSSEGLTIGPPSDYHRHRDKSPQN